MLVVSSDIYLNEAIDIWQFYFSLLLLAFCVLKQRLHRMLKTVRDGEVG